YPKDREGRWPALGRRVRDLQSGQGSTQGSAGQIALLLVLPLLRRLARLRRSATATQSQLANALGRLFNRIEIRDPGRGNDMREHFIITGLLAAATAALAAGTAAAQDI